MTYTKLEKTVKIRIWQAASQNYYLVINGKLQSQLTKEEAEEISKQEKIIIQKSILKE